MNHKKTKGLIIRNSTAEFLMFTADSRQDGLEVRFQDETVWLTQKLMAELFQCSTDNISLHLKNIFKDGELEEKSVAEDFSVTASDGKKYRVNSIRATQFRQWATRVLKEFAILDTVQNKMHYAIHGQTSSTLHGFNYLEKIPKGKNSKI